MPTSYPGGLDAFTNPTAGDMLDNPPHDVQHANANDAVEAIEAELGTSPSGGFATVKARIEDVEARLRSYLVDPGLRPPTTPGSGDVEFADYTNGTNPTAGPGLTWGNQGAATGAVNSGRLVMQSDNGSNAYRALLKATPGSGNFEVATSVEQFALGDFHAAALCLLWGTPATPTAIETRGIYSRATDSKFAATQLNATTWAPSSDRTTVAAGTQYRMRNFLLVTWDGTDLVYSASLTGVAGTWRQIASHALGLGRPDYVGVAVNTGSHASRAIGTFDFLRFGWSAADYDPTVHS